MAASDPASGDDSPPIVALSVERALLPIVQQVSVGRPAPPLGGGWSVRAGEGEGEGRRGPSPLCLRSSPTGRSTQCGGSRSWHKYFKSILSAYAYACAYLCLA